MDKYVKVKQIGEGSFGKALLMKRKEDGKMCVIKQVGISKMSPKERADSKKEVKVLSRLNHANIVTYQESFEGKGNLYIVMDYCEGGDLHQYINRQKGVHIKECKVVDIFVQCCLAIKYIHDRKILHRDIKTQNIFLTKDSIVKLGDFGIARVLKSTMELAHTCIGTPYYLSPEIVENRPYNNKSDIWSLGCVLYEMATLKHAFEAGNMKNLVMKIVRGSYPPVSNRYSFELRSLVAQTFKRSPSDRPSINTILKKPIVQKVIGKFVSPEELEGEFSDISVQKPKPKPVVQAPVAVVEPLPKKAVAAKRSIEIANIYGASVAKKPVPNRKPINVLNPGIKQKKKIKQCNPKSSNENSKEIAARERRRRNFVVEEHKHLQQMNKVQKERWQRQNLAQMKIARGAGWKNVLGVTGEEMKEKKAEENPSGDDQQKKYQAVVMEEAGNKNNDCKEEKPIFPIKNLANIAKDPVEQKPGNPFAKQMNAWGEVPQKPQVNVVKENLNCERAKLLEDYWQRKKEADANKMRAHQDMYGKVNWKPPNPNNNKQVGAAIIKNKPPSAYPAARNKQEQDYLRQLEAIRYQNFIERRAMNQMGGKEPGVGPNMKGDPRYDPEARKQKIQALKKQAEERGAFLLQKCKHPEKQVVRKPADKVQNKISVENYPDKRALPPQNKVKKEEMIIPPVGIATAMREVNKPKLFKSCSEGDLQDALQKADQACRKNWPISNLNSIGLGNLPMEITASAMEATVEDDRECVMIRPVIDRSDRRKYWVHEGKTQLVENLCNKEISNTLAPTSAFGKDTTRDDHLKNTNVEPSTNVLQEGCSEINISEVPVQSDESCNGSNVTSSEVNTNKQLTSSIQTSSVNTINDKTIEATSNNLINSPSSKTIVISTHENVNSNTVTYPASSPLAVKNDDTTTSNISTHGNSNTITYPTRISPLVLKNDDNTIVISTNENANSNTITYPTGISPLIVKNGKTIVISTTENVNSNTITYPTEISPPVVKNDDITTSNISRSPNTNTFVISQQSSILPKCLNDSTQPCLHDDDDKLKGAFSTVTKNVTTAVLLPEEDVSKSKGSIESNNVDSDVVITDEKPVQHLSLLQDVSVESTDMLSENIECCEDSVLEDVKWREDSVSEIVIPSSEENLQTRSMKAPVEAWSECTTPEVKENETNHMVSIPDNIAVKEDMEDVFHTPSRAFGLQSGFYDTAKKLLRTCSMPDLTVNSLLFPSSPENDDIQDADNSTPLPVNLVEEFPLEKEAVLTNDVKEEEHGDEENESEINIEEFDEEEVDDYASMLESMNDLLSNTDEEITNDDDETNEEDNVDWDSDEDENEISLKTAKEKDMKMKDDLFSRNEESRKTLEDELGLELFLKVYRHLQMIQDDEDDELELGTGELSNLLGDKEYLYQKILYLVMADNAYCEGNDGLECVG